MSEPYIGEIRMVSFSYNPEDWALCDGRLLSVNKYPALFSLIGIDYGGDGRTTFAVPDLRGRVPVHIGSGPQQNYYNNGYFGGFEHAVLHSTTMPSHSHLLDTAATPANQTVPQGNAFAPAEVKTYANSPPSVPMAPLAVQEAGGNQAHANLQPYQTINFIIALEGIYPSRT